MKPVQSYPRLSAAPGRQGVNLVTADITNMALFCDFENIALGVRDAKYSRFDIQKVLERLLLKGSIVVKKAYCDWDRYREFKAGMHEASFELIEIPHVRDVRQEFSGHPHGGRRSRPLLHQGARRHLRHHQRRLGLLSARVSKLRENAKVVIGVGVKNSTSDLLIANCDEFIYYDDLVREKAPRRAPARKAVGKPSPGVPAPKGEEDKKQGSDRSDPGHSRSLDCRARRGGEDLGFDGQAGAEAAHAGIQRVLLRIRRVQRPPGGGADPGLCRTRARRKVRRLYRAYPRQGPLGREARQIFVTRAAPSPRRKILTRSPTWNC